MYFISGCIQVLGELNVIQNYANSCAIGIGYLLQGGGVPQNGEIAYGKMFVPPPHPHPLKTVKILTYFVETCCVPFQHG